VNFSTEVEIRLQMVPLQSTVTAYGKQ
jgi:hypothetical protein